MPFSSKDQNPVPDLVEVKARAVPCEDDDNRFKLVFELRIHPSQFEEQIGTVEVEIFEATLSLDVQGMQIVPKSKLGQPTVPTLITQTVQVEETISNSTDAESAREITTGASVRLTPVSQKLEAKGAAKLGAKEASSVGSVVKRTFAEEDTFYHVEAIGNDNWKIAEKDEARLDGVYINSDPLCEVTSERGANRTGFEAELLVKQKHLKARVLPESGWRALFGNGKQQRIAEILIKKSLHSAGSGEPFKGIFVFSKNETYDEE